MAFNVAGAGFSYFRNTVPGMREKVDYRISIIPNEDIYSFRGKKHFEQQRFLLAFKGSGFDRLSTGPMRFMELHVGYYATDFDLDDRAAGLEPKQRPFVGIGINFTELFLRNSTSGAGKGARAVLEYFQPPYTSLRLDNQLRIE